MLINMHFLSNSQIIRTPILSQHILNDEENRIIKDILSEFESINKRINECMYKTTIRYEPFEPIKKFEKDDMVQLIAAYDKREVCGKIIIIPSVAFGVSILRISPAVMNKLSLISKDIFNEVSDLLHLVSTRIANFNRQIVMIHIVK